MGSTLDRKSVRAEIEATYDVYSADRRDELVPLIRGIQQAATRQDFMAVQLQLRDTFAGRQHGLDEIRRRRAADKAERRRIAARKPQPREEVRRLGEQIARSASASS
jgi:hypothetical protein